MCYNSTLNGFLGVQDGVHSYFSSRMGFSRKGNKMSRFALILCLSAVQVYAVSTSFLVTNTTDTQEKPAISNHFAVWADADSGDIKGKSLESGDEFVLSHSSNLQQRPDIDGNIVVWQENFDVIGYNLQTGQRIEICVDGNSQSRPRVGGNFVVWEENSGVFGCYLDDLVKFEINPDEPAKYRPDTDGEYVVWIQLNSTQDIYGTDLNLGGTHIICNEANIQTDPRIDDRFVVWSDKRNNSHYDIYGKYFNEAGEMHICNDAGDQTVPTVDEGVVVWHDKNGAAVKYENLNNGMNGTLASGNNPAIDNYTVLYEAAGDIYGIYLNAIDIITITKPVSGDFVSAGKPTTIKWDTMPPVDEHETDTGVVTIRASINGDDRFDCFIANTYNDGSFETILPAEVYGENCRIKIVDAGALSVYDESGFFTVAQCNENLSADLTGDCTVDMKDLAIFTQQWLNCGNPFDNNCTN